MITSIGSRIEMYFDQEQLTLLKILGFYYFTYYYLLLNEILSTNNDK